MTRDQAELFANDIALAADGVDRLLSRIKADPDLRSMPLSDIVVAIHSTGALDRLAPLLDKLGVHAMHLMSAGAELAMAAAATKGSDTH